MSKSDNSGNIKELEEEIKALEKELNLLETEVNTFEARIRSALSSEIEQINKLTALYKQLKQAKKQKRLLQKQKGKNYKPTQSIVPTQKNAAHDLQNPDDAQHLKKLYKEAVMQVHPDKFDESDADTKERAHDLTAALIGVYKSGDLERLIALHEHIMSGNALSHVPFDTTSVVDGEAMEAYLRSKRDDLVDTLQKLKDSYLYEVLHSYVNPLHFIDELRSQFAHRISQLQKRTRKA